MNGHLDADFFSDRNDGFKEIFQVLAQAVFIHAFILFKQVRQFFQPFRFPAGKDEAIAVVEDFPGHVLRRLAGDEVVIISQDRRTVVKGFSQVGPGPVKDGHEVVADHLDAGFGSIAQGRDVIFNILVTAGQAQFDVFMDVDAFQILEDQVVRFSLLFDVKQRFYRPYFTDRNVE